MTTEDKPEWIVNDIAELGVLVNDRAFFLYKGESLEYDDPTHDDGTPVLFRPVFKREFGECCHPKDYWTADGQCRYPETYTVGDGWRPLSELSSAKPEASQSATSPDLATIVGKCGDLGIKAISAMSNVSEDEVRRALAQDRARLDDRDRLVADANNQADGRRRAGEGLRHILGLLGMPKDTPLVLVDDAERLGAALLSELWVRRDGVSPSLGDHDHDAVTSQLRADALTGQRPVCPPPGWTLKPSWTGGCDALDGPGESRIRIEPWGFAVTDADGDEAAAMRCAMAIHERRYGGASDPSTVTVQVLTSADIERLVLLFYWLTTKMPWHDLLGAIIDSAGVDMSSPGAEALARELVAELLRKNNGDDHGCG